jgi:regulator of sigma E protease
MTTLPEPSRRGPAHSRASVLQPAAGEQRTSTWSWLLLAGIVLALILAKWTLLIAVLGLAFLITIHEFGHFVFAKMFGMRVERFYIGFPPAAWRRQRGETEYGIGLIPLGGFCKISGMTQEEEIYSQGGLLKKTFKAFGQELHWNGGVEHRDSAIGQGYLAAERLSSEDTPGGRVSLTGYQYESVEAAERSSWLKAAEHKGQPVAAGPAGAHLILNRNQEKGTISGSTSWRCSNLAFRVSATRPWSAQAAGAEAEAQALTGQLADLAGRLDASVRATSLCEPLGSRVYYNQPVWKRNLTIAAGPIFNILAAAVILFVFLMAQGISQPTLKIDTVAATITAGGKATPATLAGLKPGDTLVGAVVAGSQALLRPPTWTTWDEALAFLQGHPGARIELVYRTAAGQQRTADVTLATNPNTPKGAAPQGFLGVTASQAWQRQAPWTAAWLAVKDTGGVIKSTFQGFYWLASGKVSVTGRQGAAGPVGIISISSNAVQQGFYPILLALISVNLGILNLIPILPFDGGHIFFNTLERIRGRRIDKRVMERAAAVGVALLLFLFVFLTYNDIRRLFGG